MSGQVVDCECGKKLRVPTVAPRTQESRSGPSSLSEGMKDKEPAVDRSPEPTQSVTSSSGASSGPKTVSDAGPSAGPSPGPSPGFGAAEQNPFTTTSTEVNPYAASNSPQGGTNQPVFMQTSRGQGLAIASLVLGICSLTLVCCGGFLIGIPAVICGVIAIKQANRGEATGKGMAIAGVTTGGISLALFVSYLILVILAELLG